jgi:hypothetical protein
VVSHFLNIVISSGNNGCQLSHLGSDNFENSSLEGSLPVKTYYQIP